jgi:hypothetical protein
VRHLLEHAGMVAESLEPAGGMFRVLARRLFNAGQAVPWLMPLFAVPALIVPVLDRLDRKRHFTLGHICIARKP